MAEKIIGTVTTCDSPEHPYLCGLRVRIVAVLRGQARPDFEDCGDDDTYIKDDHQLERLGGVTADDRIEVQPWLEGEKRFSFISSDPRAADLDCFRHLKDQPEDEGGASPHATAMETLKSK